MGSSASKDLKSIGSAFGIRGDPGQVLAGFINLPFTILGQRISAFFGGLFSGIGSYIMIGLVLLVVFTVL